MKTRKLTILSMLTAIALTIFMVEAQIPPLTPVPGIKMGLVIYPFNFKSHFWFYRCNLHTICEGHSHNIGQVIFTLRIVIA